MAKIDIKDLIGGAVENALARREEALTTEEANQIQGGGPGPIVTLDWQPTIYGRFPPTDTDPKKYPTF